MLKIVWPDNHFQNKYLIFRNPTENPLKPLKISNYYLIGQATNLEVSRLSTNYIIW